MTADFVAFQRIPNADDRARFVDRMCSYMKSQGIIDWVRVSANPNAPSECWIEGWREKPRDCGQEPWLVW